MSVPRPHRRRDGLRRPLETLRGPDWLERLRAAESQRTLGTLGRFTILGEAGHGGQGTVYRARDPVSGEIVAIKRLHPAKGSHEETLQRLANEIRAAGALSHPNVVRTLGAESHGSDLLLVLEWVDGVALHDWAWPGGRRRPVAEVVAVFASITAVMAHAHGRGVLHRDFKPSNVLVDESGEPRLLDFGLAKLEMDAPASTAASTGFLGTLAYAPPELVSLGPAALDARSDLYSLGVTMYELLAGRPPYELGGSISTAVEAILKAEPATLADAGVPPDLEAIVARLLAKRPDDRYPTAGDLLADLARHRQGLPVAASRPAPRRSASSPRHRRRLSAVAGGILVIALALVATDTHVNRRVLADESTESVRAFLAASHLTRDSAPEWSTTDVRAVVDLAAARAAEALAADPAAEARARIVLARHYAELGLWRDVEAQGARALVLLESRGQTRSRSYAAALAHVGFARARNGDPAAAPALRRALALEDQRPAPARKVVEEARLGLDLLARSAEPVADDAAAEAAYDGALVWLAPDGNLWTAWLASLSDYVRTRISQGRSEDALLAVGRAIEMTRRLTDEPATTRALVAEVNGEAFALLERWPEAEDAYREALDVRRGRLDTRVPPALSNLATAVLRQDRPAEAIELYHRAAVARCELLAAATPAARPAFEAMAARLRRDGLRPEDVRALDDLLRRHAPDIVPMFLYTARRIAETHAQLGHRATSDALREAIRSVESARPAAPITARAGGGAAARG